MDVVAHPAVIPGVMREELPERADGGAGGQRDRLDALAGQVAEQPAAVGAQVLEGGKPRETLAEAAKEFGQRRPRPAI